MRHRSRERGCPEIIGRRRRRPGHPAPVSIRLHIRTSRQLNTQVNIYDMREVEEKQSTALFEG